MQQMISNKDELITIGDIHAWIQHDLTAVNAVIEQRLTSKIPLIKQICQHIIQCGGKRLRPTVVLLMARACGYQGDEHIELGAIVEMLHTATLLHDDVVDSAEMRRGKATANIQWGNTPSILVGDFLYSRIFQMMTELNRMPILTLLSNTTNQMAEGEMLQLLNRNEPTTEEHNYMTVIQYKTAELFAAAAQLGAIIADQSLEIQTTCYNYGYHLGIAFQLIDDTLDYEASSDNLGKTIGNDLAEGKVTLPIIYALNHAEADQKLLIEEAIRLGETQRFQEILKCIQGTGAIDYTKQLAQNHIKQAIDCLTALPSSTFVTAMTNLAEFAIQRHF